MKFSKQIFSGLLAVLGLLTFGGKGLAAPRPPGPPFPELVRATYVARFDEGYTNNIIEPELVVKGYGRLIESWSGYALQRAGAVMPFIIDGVDQNGRTNVMGGTGAVRLWVKPYWSSSTTGEGKGPGEVAQVLELSVTGQKQSAPVWSLQVSVDGSVLSLLGAGEKEAEVLLKAEIAWRAGEWHQIVLNYSEKGTALVLDGEFVAEGPGTLAVPPKVAALTVGSSLVGTESFEGEIEEVFCFVRPLKGAFQYSAFKETVARGPISAEETAYRAELALRWKAAKALKAKEAEEFGGGMMLRMSGPVMDCVTNGPVYLTNVVCNFSTNDGWTLAFDVAGGTNEVVYDLFATPELAGSNTVWTWLETALTCETHIFTNQATNQMFYTILTPGADRDGDALYDGWEWKHFGTLAQTAEGDYDGNGMSNGYSYTNQTDPNQIVFALNFAALHVSGNSASASVVVLEGVPDQMAVLVNNTNFAAAVWQPYQSNIVANLGNSDGAYSVWVGLRGRAWDAQQIWRWTKIFRDTSPPVIFVSSPSTNITPQSLLQLQGYAREELSAAFFDITNSAGLVTNHYVFVTEQTIDTNTFQFNTNFFQGYDITLTPGPNRISLRAVDLAGNMTTTNITLTLDYSGLTNPPVLNTSWPQNMTQLSGTNFTCYGSVDIASAEISIHQINANGLTNTFHALVGRDRKFWIEDIPLNPGTNVLTLTATNAAGIGMATNVTVVKSTLILRVNPVVPDSQLWLPTIDLTGTISDATYAVWINGTKGTNNGDGTWSAVRVPITEGGTASFEVTAFAPDEEQPDGSYGN